MPDRFDIENALMGRWVHVFEEDTKQYRVFRPASFKLPSARGRAEFDIGPGLLARSIGAGPTDKKADGDTFKLRLEYEVTGQDENTSLKFRLDAPDRLLIRKE